MKIQEYNDGTRKALYQQAAAGSGKRREYGGIDYVVVLTALPGNDVEFPRILHPGAIEKRGLLRKNCGDGWARYTGPKSQLGQALRLAQLYMRTSAV